MGAYLRSKGQKSRSMKTIV